MKLIATITALKLAPLLLAFALLQPPAFPPDPPGYRAFATGHEFAIHRDKWLVARHGHWSGTPGGAWVRVSGYDNQGVYTVGNSFHSWDDLLSRFLFADGHRPCGVGRD